MTSIAYSVVVVAVGTDVDGSQRIKGIVIRMNRVFLKNYTL